jgi:nitroreductase
MDFTEAVRRRRMVRAYDPSRTVSRETVDGLVELATHAPSAGFSQGWHFLVLDQPDSVSSFWELTGDGEPADAWLTGMRSAPVLIVALSDKQAYLDRYAAPGKGWTDRDEARWPVPYWHIDTGMACLLILLGAVDAGLGACFFGVPPEHLDGVRQHFGVPDRLTPVGVISLGHPAPDRRSPSLRRGRRAAESVTSYNRYQDGQPSG